MKLYFYGQSVPQWLQKTENINLKFGAILTIVLKVENGYNVWPVIGRCCFQGKGNGKAAMMEGAPTNINTKYLFMK